MSNIRKAHKAWRDREKAIEATDKACTRWGVFVWRGDGRYPHADVVGGKLYKSRTLADKAADRDPERRHVARSVDVCSSAERDRIRSEELSKRGLVGARRR